MIYIIYKKNDDNFYLGTTKNIKNRMYLHKTHCKTKQQKLEVFKKEVIDRVRIKDLPKSCCLCEEEFHGFGNNAQPLKDGVCCDSCNTEVIMARLKTIL